MDVHDAPMFEEGLAKTLTTFDQNRCTIDCINNPKSEANLVPKMIAERHVFASDISCSICLTWKLLLS